MYRSIIPTVVIAVSGMLLTTPLDAMFTVAIALQSGK